MIDTWQSATRLHSWLCTLRKMGFTDWQSVRIAFMRWLHDQGLLGGEKDSPCP